MTTQQQLVTPEMEELLRQEERIKAGYREQVLAMHDIATRKLYESMGYKTILDYAAERLDYKKSKVYQMIDDGGFFAALPSDSTIAEKVTNPEQLRHLSGMKATSKVKVLATAVAVAERRGEALTGKLVQDVARTNFRWKPKAEFQREKKERKQQESGIDPRVAKFKAHAMAIVSLSNPEDMVESTTGDAFEWPWFKDLKDWIERAAKVSP